MGDHARTDRLLEARGYRCGPGARWLPRTMAAAVLCAAVGAALRVQGPQTPSASRLAQGMVVLIGAALSFWLVQRGAEVRRSVGFDGGRLVLSDRRHRTALPFEEIDGLRYEHPLSVSRHWIPATVVLRSGGGRVRLPALLEHGDRLVRELLERSGREDLAAWAEALDLERRMGRAGRLLAIGYTLSAAILLAGVTFALG